MQEEILELYEKIKDQISLEQFQVEMSEVRESFGLDFVDDLNCAQEVLKNHGIDTKKIKRVTVDVAGVESVNNVGYQLPQKPMYLSFRIWAEGRLIAEFNGVNAVGIEDESADFVQADTRTWRKFLISAQGYEVEDVIKCLQMEEKIKIEEVHKTTNKEIEEVKNLAKLNGSNVDI